MDFTRFFSKVAVMRRPSLLRQLAELYFENQGAISLAGGMPNSLTFPFGSIDIDYGDGNPTKLKNQELALSLQYGPSQGLSALTEKWRKFQRMRHQDTDFWDVAFTAGSQDGCCKIFEMVLNREDSVMVQTPTYPGTIHAWIMDYARFYNDRTKRRINSYVSTLGCYRGDMIQLGDGKTNNQVFPIDEVKVRLKNDKCWTFDKYEMGEAFGLGEGQGCKVLIKLLREMQNKYHEPAKNDWDVLLTVGAQDGLNKIFESFLEIGEPIMVQVPVYYCVIDILAPLASEIIEIPQDEDGLIVDEIDRICQERLRCDKPIPKILYTNPTGANPTGTVLSDDKRRALLELARKYDFLIIEDDPYYFLHFLEETPASLFSMDTEGRVIRLDSFSKILSPGLRLGVVTAHKKIVEKLILHMESSVLHASSLSQMILYKLLQSWGPREFDEHVSKIQKFYKSRRDTMLTLLEKHLEGLAEWTIPKGGLFVWMKVTAIDDVKDLVINECIPQGVFVLPGHAFYPESSRRNQYIRLCYSYANTEDIDKALFLIARLVRAKMAKEDR